jgi:hypothetical protein
LPGVETRNENIGQSTSVGELNNILARRNSTNLRYIFYSIRSVVEAHNNIRGLSFGATPRSYCPGTLFGATPVLQSGNKIRESGENYSEKENKQ